MNQSMKYLTPKMPITEIERQRAEEAEEQNIDLYEAIARSLRGGHGAHGEGLEPRK